MSAEEFNISRGSGLFECHGHIMMDGADYKAACARHTTAVDTNAVRAAFEALRANGVVYFRDGGDRFCVCRTAAELAGEYGIEYVHPAFAIHKKGCYGGIVGRAYADFSEYRRLLEALRAEGGTFVKLIVSGIIRFDIYGRLSCPPVPCEEIRELINIARGEGFSVMVHANGAESVKAASGADSIEHGYFADAAAIEAMGAAGAVWVPTLAAVSAFAGRPGFDSSVVEETLDRQLRLVSDAASAGMLIASGSDSGAAGVPHGKGTLEEYRLLEAAGVSPEASACANAEIRRRFHG